MVKSLLSVLKSTVLLLICILLPLFIAMKVIQSNTKKDALACIDSFIQTECVGLSKNIGLQFEATEKEVRILSDELKLKNLEKEGTSHEALMSFVQGNPNLVAINIYRDSGKFFSSSGPDELVDFDKEDVPDFSQEDMKDKIKYSIDQLEDTNQVVLKFYTPLKLKIKDKKENFFVETTMKWDRYEKYMNQLEQGSFPRQFYIISPDCRRYVSLNALPLGAKTQRAVTALGLHLVSRINSIKAGLSEVSIESTDFKIFKNEIKMPANMVGNKFYMVVASDEEATDVVSGALSSGIANVLIILCIVWLLLCIVLARFYSNTKDQLEISNTITESTPLAVIIYKAVDGKILQVNLSAKTLFRIENERINEINMWNIFITDEDKEYIENAINSKIQVLNCEILVQSFGGASFWSIVSACPIDIKEERYIVLAVLDINARKEIEKKLANNAEILEQQIAERTADLEVKAKELERSNADLEKARTAADKANDAKSKFLTSMSNELKTPLNAIIGYAEILQEEALDRKDTVSSDDLRKIIGAAKHLLSLIDEILDLSKIEEGKTQLFFENIDITGIIKDVEGVTMPLVADHNNSLFLEYPRDIGVMYTDGTKIRQCLLNLLGNAAKFTEFGKVTLRVSPIVKGGQDFIEFAVIDNGTGIAPEKLEKIWDAFNEENGNKGAGAGLGLSITKKYTEYLGGEVAVESEVGVGSKFMMRVPRVSNVESNEFIEVKNHSVQEEEAQLEEEFAADMENSEETANDSSSGYSFTA